jgi:hypothetical protein
VLAARQVRTLTACLIFNAASLWARKDLNLRAAATLPTAYKTGGILARAVAREGPDPSTSALWARRSSI